MFSILVAALLSVVASEEPTTDYASAYHLANQEGKPLMVVVGADWCPACVNLKQHTITSLKSAGALSGVNLALVDRDNQPSLAGKLMRGSTMPQIIVYTKKRDNGSWTRMQLTGYQSADSVRSLINAAVEVSGS